MDTHSISPDSIRDKIIEFLTKMKTQDNRSTASPYFYVIRTAENRVTDGDYDHDRVVYYHSQFDDLQFDSVEEFKEHVKEHYDDEEHDIDGLVDDLKKIYLKKEWVEHGMFLTETDAKNHLLSNHYHYSSDAHTYVKHAWRAPELKSFFENLFTYFGV